MERLKLACLRLNLAVPGGREGPAASSHPTGRAACSTPGWAMGHGLGKENLFSLLATSAGFLACYVSLKICPEKSMLV